MIVQSCSPSSVSRTPRFRFVLFALPMALAAVASRAEVLINPVGGTVLFGDSQNWDDSVVNRNIGFTLDFFGAGSTALDVSTNGNLNFNSSASFNNESLPNASSSMIAALWDDLYIFASSGQSIVEKTDPGTYYSVTWNVAQFTDPSQLYRFQAALFGASTTINGSPFLPNDIVFSYDLIPVSFRDGSATVGLNQGNGIDFASPPGVADGIITNSNASLLPTGLGTYLLFRPNGSGYDVSVGSAPVPEIDPAGLGSVLALVTGALGLLERRRSKAA